MKKLILASKNVGKIDELRELLKPLDIDLASAIDMNLPDVEETGSTFVENALLKARSACAFSGLPALADDSGLCVDALGGAPGVFSARYGGAEKLLSELSATKKAQERRAHFMCVLALCFPDGEKVIFEGRIDGHITNEMRGDGGFGYDPVFIPEGDTRTYAEMTNSEKAVTSHRARALKDFISALNKNEVAL